MRLPLLILAAALCAAPGCFVAEELEKSSAMMEQRPQEQGSGEVASGPPAPSLRERALGAWQGLRDRILPADAPPEPDPFVHCQLAGGTRFTSELDCVARGGRVLL